MDEMESNMPALHTLIQEMNTKHDEAIERIVGPLMEAMARITEIRYNYTGEEADLKEFYERAESYMLHYLEVFSHYERRGTYEVGPIGYQGEGE